MHLLAVGGFTYTSDDRFTARHAAASQDWLLMIHYLQERDAGFYECQISTTPPKSHLIHLSVVGECGWVEEGREECLRGRKDKEEVCGSSKYSHPSSQLNHLSFVGEFGLVDEGSSKGAC